MEASSIASGNAHETERRPLVHSVLRCDAADAMAVAAELGLVWCGGCGVMVAENTAFVWFVGTPSLQYIESQHETQIWNKKQDFVALFIEIKCVSLLITRTICAVYFALGFRPNMYIIIL
jgi:hypothetical protein